jgi:hypothetical protein
MSTGELPCSSEGRVDCCALDAVDCALSVSGQASNNIMRTGSHDLGFLLVRRGLGALLDLIVDLLGDLVSVPGVPVQGGEHGHDRGAGRREAREEPREELLNLHSSPP